MPRANIEIGLDSYKNVDEISTRNGLSPLVFDAMKTDIGDDEKRHGYRQFTDLATGKPIDGIFWSKKQKKLFAVSNGIAYTVIESGGATNIGSGLEKSGKVFFKDDGTRVNMANGGAIYHSTAGGTLTQMVDGDAPTEVIGLGMIDGYLVAQTLKQIHFSNPVDTTEWSALDFFTAESRPDDNVALQVAFEEVTIFGTESIDVYFNDGVSPFSILDGGFKEKGCIAPDSVARDDEIFFFLSSDKEVTILAGRTLENIGKAIGKEIQGYDVVEDAVGNIVKMFGKKFYVLSFPTEQKTWAFRIDQGSWTPWSFWNSYANVREAFRMRCYCYVPDWNKHLIGDSRTGRIYEWHPDFFDDDGREIRLERLTGHIDHGDQSIEKICHGLYFKLKRGVNTTITPNTREGKLLIKFRTNNEGWSNERTVSLGFDGDTKVNKFIKRLGRYHVRQWSFVHTDPTPFTLINPLIEHFDSVGRN